MMFAVVLPGSPVAQQRHPGEQDHCDLPGDRINHQGTDGSITMRKGGKSGHRCNYHTEDKSCHIWTSRDQNFTELCLAHTTCGRFVSEDPRGYLWAVRPINRSQALCPPIRLRIRVRTH